MRSCPSLRGEDPCSPAVLTATGEGEKKHSKCGKKMRDVGVKTGTGDVKVDFKFRCKRLKEKGSVRKLTNGARALRNQYL